MGMIDSTKTKWVDTAVVFDHQRKGWKYLKDENGNSIAKTDDPDGKIYFRMYRNEG